MLTYIDRDLIRTFLISFITLFLFVQTGLLVYRVLDLYEYAFTGGESRLGWLLLFYLFSIPGQAVETVSIATAVSVLWTFTVKARQNELLAYLVGGISPVRIAAPLLVVSLLFSVGAFAVTELIVVRSERTAERIEKLHIQGRKLESVTKEENVFQKGQGNRFYNVVSFSPSEQRMEFMIILQMNDDWTGPQWRVDAEYGELTEIAGEDHWAFYNATYREFSPQGSITEYREEDRILDTELDPPIEPELDRYIQQRFRPEQMTTVELLEYIELFELQDRSPLELRTILHQNFAVPFGSFVLALLMCGHILRPRSTGLVVGFGGGLVLLALYFVTLIFGRESSLEGVVDPIIGLHGPNLLFLIIGALMLSRDRLG